MDISIIIPTFNRLWCLPEAIESCFKSDLKIEVIVVDDGSTDGSNEWLSSRTDIVLITQKNQGKDWAVNNGLKYAKGKYIRFLDSDDWLLPFSSDQLFKEAEAKNVDLVAAGYNVCDETGNLERVINWTICDDFIAQQLGECDSSHYSAYLFKKSFIEEIPHRQEYGSRDDRKFILEVALKNPSCSYILEPTFVHRMHSKERLQRANGLMNTLNNLAYLKIFQTTLAELDKLGTCTQRRKNAAVKSLWPLAQWVAKDHVTEAVRLIKWIKVLDPAFSPSKKGVIGFGYKTIGFKLTSHLQNLRRLLFYS